LYSVLHPYLFLCLHYPAFCLLSSLTTHNTNIRVPGGIRTHNPCRWVATDPRPKLRGQRDWCKSINCLFTRPELFQLIFQRHREFCVGFAATVSPSGVLAAN
jgi:hypothetical protein